MESPLVIQMEEWFVRVVWVGIVWVREVISYKSSGCIQLVMVMLLWNQRVVLDEREYAHKEEYLYIDKQSLQHCANSSSLALSQQNHNSLDIKQQPPFLRFHNEVIHLKGKIDYCGR